MNPEDTLKCDFCDADLPYRYSARVGSQRGINKTLAFCSHEHAVEYAKGFILTPHERGKQ